MSGYDQVYLSPHLDDAAFSCGGRINQLAQAGERALVVTIFAGSPPFVQGEGELPSEYSVSLHRRWATGVDAPAVRRAEDRAAARVLGADFHHLSYLECIYRQHPLTGEFLYQSDEDIFAEVHPVDFSLAAELREKVGVLSEAWGETMIYSPLALGHHVDHQLVAATALELQAAGHRVAFYEDYPYAEDPRALAAARRWMGGENWRPEILPLRPVDLAVKTEAAFCYRSQLSTFFEDDEEVAPRLRLYATSLSPQRGPCERIWHLTK